MIKEYIPVKRVFEINENGEQLPLSDKVEIKNNQALLNLKYLENGNPIGTLVYSFSNSVPNGYLVCNGAEVSIETYQDLYDVIGNTYGTASSGKFKLPDLIDRVAWGGSGVGIIKEAGLPNITGELSFDPNIGIQVNENYVKGAFFNGAQKSYNIGFKQGTSYQTKFNASRCSSIYGKSTTVQPPALTLLPCIKY